MAKIISASIDLTKIDKSKIVEGKKGGKFYNIQIFCNDDFDQYKNDVSIAEGQTKEQREAKQKKNYLGNGRTIWSDEGKVAVKESNISEAEILPDNNDDLAF